MKLWSPLLLMASACVPLTGPVVAQAPERGPNIVVISIDGLRMDHTGMGGARHPTTPNMDALAAQGVWFDQSFSAANESLFSHAALFAGRPASELAWPDYRTYTVPKTTLVLAEALQAVGYDTAAFISGGHVQAEMGFDQGFGTFMEGPDFGSFQVTAPLASGYTSKRARKDPDGSPRAPSAQPFFLFLHGYDCHRPYAKDSVFWHPFDSPKEGPVDRWVHQRQFTEQVFDGVFYPEFSHSSMHHEGGKKMLDPLGYVRLAAAAAAGEGGQGTQLSQVQLDHILAHYDAAVLAADTYVGLFLEDLAAQGLWEDTLVIITSDHGEDLQDHGYYNHRAVLTDSTTRVPFLVTGGALPKHLWGTRSDTLVSAVDLVPTVMAMAGSVPPAGGTGENLWAHLNAGTQPTRPWVFQEGVLGQVSVRSPTHRLVFHGLALTDPDHTQTLASAPIDGPHFTLYETAKDPTEQTDVRAAQAAEAERLRTALVDWRRSLAQGTQKSAPDAATKALLQRHGYW